MGRIEDFFWRYMYGNWESVTRPIWIDGHVCILLATALVGYSVARGEYVVTVLLLPFPLVYSYKRDEKAGPTGSSRRRQSSQERSTAQRTRSSSTDSSVSGFINTWVTYQSV